MTLVQAAILGLVQGLTEFLPVSSSGHLVVAERILGLQSEGGGVFFEVVLHAGSLAAVLAIFGKDLLRILSASFKGLGLLLRGRVAQSVAETDARLGIFILVATLPTALIGLGFKDLFESLFSNLIAVGGAFLITGLLLFLSGRRNAKLRLKAEDEGAPPASATTSEKSSSWSEAEDGLAARAASSMRWTDALVIGLLQGVAITPGISRSGTTIAAALFLGLDRKLAARFSFLLSVPAILGALILHLRHGFGESPLGLDLLAFGFLCAAVSGYLALRVLLKIVDRGRFGSFAYYLWPLGAAVLAYALITSPS